MPYKPWKFLFVVFPFLSGCPANLDTPRYPTTRPTTNDLAGVYHPTAETKTLVKDKGGYPEKDMSITLNSDGSLQIANIPDWWRTDGGKPNGGFDSGNGTWQTVQSQGWWELEFSFNVTKGFAGAIPASSYFIHTHIAGQRGPYDIVLTIGDPDEGREMRFTK